jgi:DNA-binding transcriptional MerR regulator
MRIGTLAELTGCTVPTLRHYEAVGLLPAASRRTSGHREYSEAAVRRVSFIRRCRDSGFGLEKIRALLSLANGAERDCVEARDLAQEQLRSVRARMVELMALERSLSRLVDDCSATCAGGAAPGCSIFQELGLR